MMAAGAVSQYRSTLAAGKAAEAEGRARQVGAEYEAAQLDTQAGQERAAAQRTAMNERRKGDLVASRARAVAAAGGGALDSPDIQDILSNIENERDYRSGVALYEGEERARGLDTGAVARRYEGASYEAAGRTARNVSRSQAFGNLLSQGGSALSLYGRYGGGGPPGATTRGDTLSYDIGEDGIGRNYRRFGYR